jgi:hypothetical protein
MEGDLEEILEADYGMPITFTNPATGSRPTTVQGQVIYGTREQDPATGMDVYVGTPVVSVRNSRFTTLPQKGWECRIPASVTDSTEVSYIIDRVPEDGDSFGWTKFFLSRTIQE